MYYIYRYTDLKDEIIKHVGITNNVERRIKQHSYEQKFMEVHWKIEIAENYPIDTRTDAEYIESSFISYYGTDKYMNVKKAGWGVSRFISVPSCWTTIEEDAFYKDQSFIKSTHPQIDFSDDFTREAWDEWERLKNAVYLASQDEEETKQENEIDYIILKRLSEEKRELQKMLASKGIIITGRNRFRFDNDNEHEYIFLPQVKSSEEISMYFKDYGEYVTLPPGDYRNCYLTRDSIGYALHDYKQTIENYRQDIKAGKIA